MLRLEFFGREEAFLVY